MSSGPRSGPGCKRAPRFVPGCFPGGDRGRRRLAREGRRPGDLPPGQKGREPAAARLGVLDGPAQRRLVVGLPVAGVDDDRAVPGRQVPEPGRRLVDQREEQIGQETLLLVGMGDAKPEWLEPDGAGVGPVAGGVEARQPREHVHRTCIGVRLDEGADVGDTDVMRAVALAVLPVRVALPAQHDVTREVEGPAQGAPLSPPCTVTAGSVEGESSWS